MPRCQRFLEYFQRLVGLSQPVFDDAGARSSEKDKVSLFGAKAGARAHASEQTTPLPPPASEHAFAARVAADIPCRRYAVYGS